MSVSQDIWNPFVRFCMAILMAFWPLIFQWQIRQLGPAGDGLVITLILFGLYVFPGALMTTLVAGSYLNLRPDRVIGVIRACGGNTGSPSSPSRSAAPFT